MSNNDTQTLNDLIDAFAYDIGQMEGFLHFLSDLPSTVESFAFIRKDIDARLSAFIPLATTIIEKLTETGVYTPPEKFHVFEDLSRFDDDYSLQREANP